MFRPILELLAASGGAQATDLYDNPGFQGDTGAPLKKSSSVNLNGFGGGSVLIRNRNSNAEKNFWAFKTSSGMRTVHTDKQNQTSNGQVTFFDSDGFYVDDFASGSNYEAYVMRNSSGFHCAVEYTGTGAEQDVAHDLGVAPELIVMRRFDAGSANDWYVHHVATGTYAKLNTTDAFSVTTGDIVSAESTSDFTLPAASPVNVLGEQYVAVALATLAGTLKIGTYVGNGSSQNIDCGFPDSSSSFILIKRTDGSNWNLFLTADNTRRNLNTADDAVSGSNLLSSFATGFAVGSSTIVNASGVTYLFMALHD